ncbi:MAG: holdfast anchoring protein HfaA [Alphaproteobacteria bacterium]|nr:holdfast anchoring protein HfaA [Alphaproteobacteria bacterium]
MAAFGRLSLVVLCFSAAFAAIGAASAGDYGSASDYNSPYGMTAGQENQAIEPSLRDANGNLTVVNGVFTSSNMGSGSVQQMSSLGAYSSGTTLMSGGVGFGGGNVMQAQAIGNQLNVVTVGTGNTVIVNSHQTNDGDQTATVNNGGD